jgi:3-oxoacyl-[acyl-carrier-protein] synthase III
MVHDSQFPIGFSGVAGVLPPAKLSLDELSQQGLLLSHPQTLRELGFAVAHIADATHDLMWLARTAVERALLDAAVEPAEIGLLIFAGGLADSHVMGGMTVGHDTSAFRSQAALLQRFRYPSGWLQDELALDRARVLAIAQQGCASMFAAILVARNSLVAEPELNHVLCVGVDVLPANSPREIVYNVISDAAAAVVVSRGQVRERWLGYHQISRGYYWDTPARQAEIIAAYFPTARLAIAELLQQQKLRPDEIDLVIPTGIQRQSWHVLLDLAGIARDRLYDPGESFGHSICADNFLLLEQLRHQGRIAREAKLLLFTYGFGSSWCCMLLEH